MSIQAVAWVLEHSEATLADRLVLIAIANHADARGWNAYPSVPLIAREARVDERTVYRALDALKASGEVTVQRRPGHSSMYAIAALHGGDNLSGVRGDKLSGEGSQSARGPLTNRQPNHKEPSGNRRVRAREATPMPPPLPAEVKARGAEFFRKVKEHPFDAKHGKEGS